MRKLVFILMLASRLGLAVDPNCLELERACDNMVQAQDEHVARLKSQVQECTTECAQADPLVPGWALILVGVGVGALTTLYLTRR